MVAQDTEYQLVEESVYGCHDENHWRQIVNDGGNIVIHCPAMCHLLHEFVDDERVAVIFMIRDIRDIITSQERIDWTQKEEVRELAKYGANYGPVCLVKYDYWEQVQRDLFPEERRLETEYESLAGHSLWIPREARGRFGYK